jgi:molybdopterin adenylyltransferase
LGFRAEGCGRHIPRGMLRVAVLTISDAGARGTRADTSGDAIVHWAVARGDTVSERALVPDESAAIVAQLTTWCDADAADVVFTTGGTGLGPRDVTPEATRAVIEREAPGIAERVRALAWDREPRAVLSRGIAGARNRTLIVNLPGSTGGVRDALAVLDSVVNHGIEVLRGVVTDHGHIAR